MRRIVLLSLLFACAHARRGASGRWLEVRSEHFVVRTDLDEPAAREAALQLEQVRAAVLAPAWRAAEPPRDVLAVVVWKDAAAALASSDALGERRIVISGDPGASAALKHALAHAVAEDFLLRRPRWVAEGIACYLETLRLEGDHAVLGQPDPARLRWLEGHPGADFGAVLKAGDETFAMSAEQAFAFQTRAWALFHFLADARRPQLNDFLRRLARAEDPDAAFRTAFHGSSAEQLAKDVDAWAAQPAEERVAIAPWKGALSVRALDPAEAEAQRADLLWPSRPEEAKEAVESALAADPGQPLGLALAAKLGVQADAHEAVKRHADDDRAWIALLDALPEGSPERAKTAAELLKRSPHSVRALRETALAAIAQRRLGDALHLAQKAAAQAPADVSALDVLAVSLASNKRCGEADRAARRALEAVPDGAVESVRLLRARADEVKRICEGPRVATKDDLAAPPEGYVVRVPPHAKECNGAGPMVPAGLAKPGDALAVRYLVKKSGKLAALQKRSGSDALFEVVKSWLSTCKWDPATEAGVPIEDWGERTFTFR